MAEALRETSVAERSGDAPAGASTRGARQGPPVPLLRDPPPPPGYADPLDGSGPLDDLLTDGDPSTRRDPSSASEG